MSEEIKQLNPNDYPLPTPHTPFSLEGHFQPFYDDRRDYNTNAPSYYDYLANFNKLIKSIVEFVNELAKRDLDTENSETIELIKKTSWFVEGVNEIVLKANVKVSEANNNKIEVKPDGLFVAAQNVDDLLQRVTTLENNFNNLVTNFNDLKTRVDLLDGGGWASKEQLEELRKIIEANRKDYEDADSGLMLIIANIQTRLEALDGISAEIDSWTEKVRALEAETLNVKNIATMATTLLGAVSITGYSRTPLKTTSIVTEKRRFDCIYNSFTQRINGRITRIERLGFDFDAIAIGTGMDPAVWTKLGDFTKASIQNSYGGTLSNNLKRQVNEYAFRYYQNYLQDYRDGMFHPWVLRLDYSPNNGFSVYSRGLIPIANPGDITRPVKEEVITIVTWLDDNGNEYIPKYKENGDPEELYNCVPVTPIQ